MSVWIDVVALWLWVWAIASWCMCFYITCASGEGIKWFRMKLNPLLLLGAFGGVLAVTIGGLLPTYSSIFVTFAGWLCYSALVTTQHLRFRQWRHHIVPVNLPTLVLFAAIVAL